MHYVYDKYFRLAMQPLDDDCSNSMYMDLMYDEDSFDKFFQIMDPNPVKNSKIDIYSMNEDSF